MWNAWSCFLFLFFHKYSCVTSMLLELGLPSFSTVMHNASVHFNSALANCPNKLVNVFCSLNVVDNNYPDKWQSVTFDYLMIVILSVPSKKIVIGLIYVVCLVCVTIIVFTIVFYASVFSVLLRMFLICFYGYWRQWADERFGDPPPRWIQEPSVVRDKDGRPPRGPSGSALLLCV